jgi:ribosome-associated toxin RatA of RatAB toxin-antitoxin module
MSVTIAPPSAAGGRGQLQRPSFAPAFPPSETFVPPPIVHTVRTSLLALALAAAATLPVAAAGITFSTERRGDAIDIRASALLRADPATAWRVLTDYGRYAEFIPDLRESRVVARDGAKVTVEQSGDAVLWLLKIPLEITFEITESPPRSVRSQAVAGSLRALASSYVLTPVAHGVRLDYEGRVAPGFELFGAIEEMAARHNVARQFQALADEIERSSETARRSEAGGAARR